MFQKYRKKYLVHARIQTIFPRGVGGGEGVRRLFEFARRGIGVSRSEHEITIRLIDRLLLYQTNSRRN